MDIDGQVSLFDRPPGITQGEIERCLIHGGPFDHSSARIYAFFAEGHSAAENARFLADECGIGGMWPAYCCENREDELEIDYSGAGLRICRISQPREITHIKWGRVASIIRSLIDSGRWPAGGDDDTDSNDP